MAKSMPWFKVYGAVCSDLDLTLMPLAQQAVYFRLLAYSSTQEERGTIRVSTLTHLARWVANGDVATLEATLDYLINDWGTLEQIDGGYRFRQWEKYQRKPSDEPPQTRERQQKHRANASYMSRDVTPVSRVTSRDTPHVTPLSRDVTPLDKSREEEKRRDVDAPTSPSRVGVRESDDDVSVDVHPVYGLMDDTDTPEDKAFRAVSSIVETAGNTYAEHGLLDGLREYRDEPDPVAQAKSWLTKYGGQYDRPGKRVSSYLEWLKVARRDRLEGPAYRSPPNGHSPPRESTLRAVTPEEIAAAEFRFGRTDGD